MNKQRRKEIERLISVLEETKDEVETVAGEETDYVESIPENLQGSERYETAEEAAQQLEEAKDALENVIENLENARGY
jgi:methyl-accepting chemotaxis protein